MDFVTQAYSSNVLQKETHGLLVANVEQYVRS